jgi:hypothetical protein
MQHALVLAAGATADVAHAQRASTYQLSCTKVTVVGSTLSANCRRIDGGSNRTAILIPSIENIDGALRFSGAGEPSTFQNSCVEAGVAGSRIFARCRRIDGSFTRTTILIPGIENVDGVLRYR